MQIALRKIDSHVSSVVTTGVSGCFSYFPICLWKTEKHQNTQPRWDFMGCSWSHQSALTGRVNQLSSNKGFCCCSSICTVSPNNLVFYPQAIWKTSGIEADVLDALQGGFGMSAGNKNTLKRIWMIAVVAPRTQRTKGQQYLFTAHMVVPFEFKNYSSIGD